MNKATLIYLPMTEPEDFLSDHRFYDILYASKSVTFSTTGSVCDEYIHHLPENSTPLFIVDQSGAVYKVRKITKTITKYYTAAITEPS